MGFQRNTDQHFYSPKIMKRLVLCFSVVALLLASCGSKDRAADREKPEEAAVHYVQSLADGHYDEIVSAMISCDSTTEQYNRQIKTLYKQMAARKRADNGELKTVVCVRTEKGPLDGSVNAYLKLTYSNDSIEDIILPLFWNSGRWRLR